MLVELYDLSFAVICYCEGDDSAFWNNALVDAPLSEAQIQQVEEKCRELHRPAAFYFEHTPEMDTFKQILQQKGYTQYGEDSWMFFEGDSVDTARFDQVKEVQTEAELAVFLETFDATYQKDDPLNPYGELGSYLEVAKKAWLEHQGKTIQYFVAYKENEPVSVGALISFQGIGYIFNVGSKRSVRGEGFGKLVTLYCLDQSLKKSNTVHCLATEEGTNPHQFYQKLGFKTRFTALTMIKS